MAELELEYDVLTIDTNIFVANACAIEKGYFKQLAQFKESPATFVLSDIVKRELTKHIAEKIKSARGEIKSAIKVASNELLIDDDGCSQAATLLFGTGEDLAVAEARVKSFVEKTGCAIISVKHADVQELVDLYFDAVAPFEATGKKKNEFPDALALLSLDDWAVKNKKKVLAVSKDAGWKEFGDNSTAIDVVNDLGAAIQKFQVPNSVSNIVDELKYLLKNGGCHSIIDSVQKAIEKSLDEADVYIDAESDYMYEYDDVFVSYSMHEFVDSRADGKPKIELIRIESDRIVIGLEVFVTCSVEASFSFYVHDSIDNDDMLMGANTATAEEEYNTDILVTLAGDFSDGINGIEVDDVEVLHSIDSADFGYVRPGFSDDWADELEE